MKIQTVNVSKKIGKNQVLKNISITMESGNIYGLQGINGSGKTMLMRMISGLIRPSAGKVYVDQKNISTEKRFPCSIGMLLENPSFLSNYTGFQNLKLLASLNNRITDRQICGTLQDVGLNPNDGRKYRKYSLGMKQRLGIAAAVMEAPELLILDEPMNALDSNGMELVSEMILREKHRGSLVILACHDMETLYALADKIFVLEDGKLVDEISAGGTR